MWPNCPHGTLQQQGNKSIFYVLESNLQAYSRVSRTWVDLDMRILDQRKVFCSVWGCQIWELQQDFPLEIRHLRLETRSALW
jgi:hypothetical protein